VPTRGRDFEKLAAETLSATTAPPGSPAVTPLGSPASNPVGSWGLDTGFMPLWARSVLKR